MSAVVTSRRATPTAPTRRRFQWTRSNGGVVSALRETFSAESFEAHLQKTAADDAARASRPAERETLLARIPVLSAECERLADAVAAGSGTLDVLLAGIKSRQAERETTEARVAEIEGIERDLRAERSSAYGRPGTAGVARWRPTL